LRVVDANEAECDILLKEQMDKFQKEYKDHIKITHVLNHPSEGWKGGRGYVNGNLIRDNLFPPDGGQESVIFLCGPPAMIQKAVLPALREWGYEEEKDCFGF
jgi:nitrate reductase (NAD(P)H)